jgi:hypothetical protein
MNWLRITRLAVWLHPYTDAYCETSFAAPEVPTTRGTNDLDANGPRPRVDVIAEGRGRKNCDEKEGIPPIAPTPCIAMKRNETHDALATHPDHSMQAIKLARHQAS